MELKNKRKLSKMKKPKIQIKDIYGLSSILMIIVVCANLWNLIINWNTMNLPGKISFIAGSILFQLMFVTLFFILWKVTPKIGNIIEDKMLDDILEHIKTNQKEVNNGNI
jgi:hypothetical protein